MTHADRPIAHRLRLPLVLVAGAALAIGPATAALAHIDPEPPSVEAGAEATVSFTVEHGCDGSPTTKLEIQIPDGSTGIAGVDGGGFTSSVDGQVVTFEGGPLDAETPQAFAVTFTAPPTAGDVPVKLIQTCEEGSIDWIEVAAEGGEEPEHPAPILAITPSTATTTAPSEGPTTTAATSTTEAVDVAPVAEPDGAGTDGKGTADEASESEDDSSSTPWIILVLGVAAAGALGFWLAVRKKGGPPGPEPEGDAPAA